MNDMPHNIRAIGTSTNSPAARIALRGLSVIAGPEGCFAHLLLTRQHQPIILQV